MSKPDIIIPGQNAGIASPHQMNPDMKISILARQIEVLMDEINLLNMRMMVTQELLRNKTGVTDEEIKAVWEKAMANAREQLNKPGIVTPDGHLAKSAADQTKSPEGDGK